jgi:hypothetical protein
MRLCGKCVKVIDSDITEDTCWSKCYSYVITKDINILNNVKLTIQDGAGVYLLNGEFDSDNFKYNGGGIIFDAGSKLCAGNLPILSVVLEDGKYVISTKLNYNINNNGIQSKEEELVEEAFLEVADQVKLKNLSKSDKAKLHIKKMKELKKNMVIDNNQPSKFVFKSLSLEYIWGLTLNNVDSKEFYGKNINIFNSFTGENFTPSFSLDNTHICLNNLRIESNQPIIQDGLSNLGLINSTLNINKSLIVLGGSKFLVDFGSFGSQSQSLILNKCSKLKIAVANFYDRIENTTLIEPIGKLGNINQIPYLVDECLNEKVVITIKPAPF